MKWKDQPQGIPCLWRQGQWSDEKTLAWLARQIHRLLTVDRRIQAAETDAMNEEAAAFWARQTEHALPLEPPLEQTPDTPAEERPRPRLIRRVSGPDGATSND